MWKLTKSIPNLCDSFFSSWLLNRSLLCSRYKTRYQGLTLFDWIFILRESPPSACLYKTYTYEHHILWFVFELKLEENRSQIRIRISYSSQSIQIDQSIPNSIQKMPANFLLLQILITPFYSQNTFSPHNFLFSLVPNKISEAN